MDWNVIQAPELLSRLQRRLGLRQAHVTPTLNEGVQAVVILDDLQHVDFAGATDSYVGGANAVTAGGEAGCYFNNPPGSGVMVRVKGFDAYVQPLGSPPGTAFEFNFGFSTSVTHVTTVTNIVHTTPRMTLSAPGLRFSKLTAEGGGLAATQASLKSERIYGASASPWVSQRFPDPIDIPPGCAFLVESLTLDVGDTLQVILFWEEQPN